MAAVFRSISPSAMGALAVWLLGASPVLCRAQATDQRQVVWYRANAVLAPSAAAEPRNSYGSVQAAWESYHRAEQERQEAIRRQLQTLDIITWYYLSPPGGVSCWVSLPAVYAGGWRRAWRDASRAVYRFPRYAPFGVFEPWPMIPGDIYGFPWAYRSHQPSGHEGVVLGPGSYLVRPLYKPLPTVVAPGKRDQAGQSGGDTGGSERPGSTAPEPIPTPAPVEPEAPGRSRVQGPREF
ncbi:MAG: hypothetical protein ACUVUC_05305 [Thermoguttaceae bacterium]